MINHIRTYGEGENHTNTIENAFSLLKRGIYGTFHQVSMKHLGPLLRRVLLPIQSAGEQAEMFDVTLKGLLREKALPFKTLTASEEPF